MSATLQALRGMNDVLPGDASRWLEFESLVQRWLARHGYRNIRMPLIEPTQLFRRAVGEQTDIVEKEMYSWRDELNGEDLTLRPEATASCVRAAIEHHLLHDGPKRLWYAGPMYRHERPQKGRYRQFHQYGAEALGFTGPDSDAELIVMCAALWRELGLTGIRLELNTIGSSAERASYRTALITHLENNVDSLDADAKRRMHANPLRVFDSKNPLVQTVVQSAPSMMAYLGDATLAHFDGLKRLLGAAGVGFTLNPRLVRGLDYYNLTVFEWISDRLGAQGTVCGGGRYDGLFEQLGGKPAPAAGFAMGIERLIALQQEAKPEPVVPLLHAYVVHLGAGAAEQALRIAGELRDAGYAVVQHCGGGSLKSQMKKADASGARVALIIGEDELGAGEVTVKPLRVARAQARVPAARLAAELTGWNDAKAGT
ncbi:MAG: histidine--tRNA ligase [Betaproteobacteria bacterium]|nr:histidine--tRNA ligase [Betaproteobacteria bacterium]